MRDRCARIGDRFTVLVDQWLRLRTRLSRRRVARSTATWIEIRILLNDWLNEIEVDISHYLACTLLVLLVHGFGKLLPY